MMPVRTLVLSCYGHIFKFDFPLCWHNSLRMLPASACTHLCFYLDHFGTHKPSGCVACDTGGSIFPAREPYGAALNTAVLAKGSVCLFLKELWQIRSFTNELGKIRWDYACTKLLIRDSELLHLDIST